MSLLSRINFKNTIQITNQIDLSIEDKKNEERVQFCNEFPTFNGSTYGTISNEYNAGTYNGYTEIYIGWYLPSSLVKLYD